MIEAWVWQPRWAIRKSDHLYLAYGSESNKQSPRNQFLSNIAMSHGTDFEYDWSLNKWRRDIRRDFFAVWHFALVSGFKFLFRDHGGFSTKDRRYWFLKITVAFPSWNPNPNSVRHRNKTKQLLSRSTFKLVSCTIIRAKWLIVFHCVVRPQSFCRCGAASFCSEIWVTQCRRVEKNELLTC
jgi:hypothetical protein